MRTGPVANARAIAASITRHRRPVEWGVLAAGALLYLVLFRDVLHDIPFFDEWGYVTSLRRQHLSPWWILTPYQEHFIPLPRLGHYLLIVLAGEHFVVYKVVSLALYLCMSLAVYWFLTACRVAIPVRLFTYLSLLTTGAFAEVVAWSANNIRLLFGLLFFLFLGFARRYLDDGRWRDLVLANVAFLLAQLSFGNAEFYVPMVALLLASLAATLSRRNDRVLAASVVGTLVLGLVLYWGFAYSATTADYARVEAFQSLSKRLPETLMGTTTLLMRGVILPYLGLLLPVVHRIHVRDLLVFTVVVTLLLDRLYLRPSALKDRRVQMAGFLLLLMFYLEFAAYFYRHPISFVSQWNRYEQPPALAFWCAAAIGLSYAWYRWGIRGRTALGIVMAAILLVNVGQTVQRPWEWLDGLVKNRTVRMLVQDTTNTFAPLGQRTSPAYVYDFQLRWRIFMRIEPPRLSDFLYLSHRTRHGNFHFVKSLQDPNLDKVKTLLQQNGPLRSFYQKYDPELLQALSLKSAGGSSHSG